MALTEHPTELPSSFARPLTTPGFVSPASLDLSRFCAPWQDRLPDTARIVVFGGAVRDMCWGRPPRDHDFLVSGVTRGAMIKAGLETAPHPFIERFTDPFNPLTEVMRSPFPGTPAESLSAMLATRDLTVHAIGVDVRNGDVLDWSGRGVEDLESRYFRLVSPDVADDPMMVFRAFRLLARVGKPWTFDPDDLELVMHQAREQGFFACSIHRLDAAFLAIDSLEKDGQANVWRGFEKAGLDGQVRQALDRVVHFRQTGTDPGLAPDVIPAPFRGRRH